MAPKTSATSKTLFLSQFGCGTTAEDPYLLPTAQTDSEGCGTVAGLPANSWFGAGGGVGTVTWDYRLTGITTKSKSFDFGTYTKDQAVTPTGSTVETPFSIDVPKAASGLVFKSFVFTVWLHGLNVPFSAMGLAGSSYIVFPAKK